MGQESRLANLRVRRLLHPALLLALGCLILFTTRPTPAQPELQPYSIAAETNCQTLLQIMKAGDDRERQQATERLQQLRSPQLAGQLLVILQDRTSDLRVQAAQSLGGLRDSRAVPPLIAALRDPDPALRKAAAESLGRFYNQRTVDPLITALADSEIEVRKAAARSLGQLRDSTAVPALLAACRDPQAGIYPECIQALSRMRDMRIAEVMLEAITQADPEIRVSAAQGLAGVHDERAVDLLITATGDPVSRVRAEALSALASYPEARLHPVFIHALADPEPAMRDRAVKVLAQCVEKTYDRTIWQDATEPLVALLGDQQITTRTVVVRILGRLGDPRAVEPLLQCLQDEQLASMALFSLRQLHDPRVIEPLLTLCDGPPSELRSKALNTLADIGGPTVVKPLVTILLARGEQGGSLLPSAVYYLGRQSVPMLVTAFEQEQNPVQRRLLAQLLSRYADPHALDQLLADAGPQQEREVRQPAMMALAYYENDPRAREVVLTALTDPDPEISRTAIVLVDSWQDPRIVPALITVLNRKDETNRQIAAERLMSRNDPQALEALLALRNNPDAVLRDVPFYLLTQQAPHDPRALDALLEYITRPDPGRLYQLKMALAGWYARYPDDRADIFARLCALLKDPDLSTRRQAATALGALNDLRALDPLLAALHDPKPEVRLNAAYALANLGDDRAVEPLIRIARDWYEGPRTAAKQALGRLGEPRAIPALLRIGWHEQRNRRNLNQTMRALQQLGYQAYPRTSPRPQMDEFQRLISDALGTGEPAEQALQRLKEPEHFDRLIAVMRGETKIGSSYDARLRYQRYAALLLAKIGDPRAIDPLVETFRRTTDRDRCLAYLSALCSFHDARVVPCLITALRDDDPNMRGELMRDLVQYDDPLALTELHRLFTEEPAGNEANSLKDDAAVELVRRGDPEAFAFLWNGLNDPDPRQRARFLPLLARTGDPRVLELLLAAMRDPYARNGMCEWMGKYLEAVRDPALYEHAVTALLPLLEQEQDPRLLYLLLVPMAARTDPRAVPPLLRLLPASYEPWLDEAFLRMLLTFKDERAVEPLLSMLAAGLIPQRAAAAGALPQFDDPRVVPALITALQQNTTPVRVQAAASLGRLKTRDAIEPLITTLESDTSSRVRTAAAAALAEITGQAFGANPAQWREWLAGQHG